MTTRADAAVATGERLLAAAWEHFGSRPYEEVRLQDIAGDAGVTVQTLYLRSGARTISLPRRISGGEGRRLLPATLLKWGTFPRQSRFSSPTMKHMVSPSSGCCLKRIDCRPFEI